MTRPARGVALAIGAAVIAAGAAGWWATRPPPPDPLATWKGPSLDPHENRLRKLTADDGETARLRVPLGWSQRRAEGIVVLLPTAADKTGAAAAARYLALLDGPWLLLLPERAWADTPADQLAVERWIARVHQEYRTAPSRVLWIGEAEGAGVAEAAGCGGADAIVRRTTPPCGASGTAWAWIGKGGEWRPVDEPADPAAWLAEAVAAWNGT